MEDIEKKEFYFNLIEQIGHDGGACCNWRGVESLSLDEWKTAWWQEFNDHCEYERQIGAHNERKRIADELLAINNEPKNFINDNNNQ